MLSTLSLATSALAFLLLPHLATASPLPVLTTAGTGIRRPTRLPRYYYTDGYYYNTSYTLAGWVIAIIVIVVVLKICLITWLIVRCRRRRNQFYATQATSTGRALPELTPTPGLYAYPMPVQPTKMAQMDPDMAIDPYVAPSVTQNPVPVPMGVPPMHHHQQHQRVHTDSIVKPGDNYAQPQHAQVMPPSVNMTGPAQPEQPHYSHPYTVEAVDAGPVTTHHHGPPGY